ncbi:unnamed protein product [Dovyalis caffra]|uniref:Uncharacterized protein n=1 Tax=Dovyalis caffra TaxID=77055 RepID=A0AAV1SM95_9ROSI|nr:unnamed protein product [Dovyalis caffra]
MTALTPIAYCYYVELGLRVPAIAAPVSNEFTVTYCFFEFMSVRLIPMIVVNGRGGKSTSEWDSSDLAGIATQPANQTLDVKATKKKFGKT